jgi:hypothetical protein
MPLADSDFNGPTGDTFTLAISAGRIYRASLHIINQSGDTTLAVSAGNQQVTVASLPNGDSLIQLVMQPWDPGEPNATVSLVLGSSGKMVATSGNPTIYDGNTFGMVNLFGS